MLAYGEWMAAGDTGPLDNGIIYCLPLNDGYDYFDRHKVTIQKGDEKQVGSQWMRYGVYAYGHKNNDPLRRPKSKPWGEQIAEGRNRPKLTNSQVGEGYRLLELGENIPENAETWAFGSGPWTGNFKKGSKLTILQAPIRVPIPKPKKTVPLEAEDWKGIWWIKDPCDESTCYRLVTEVGDSGVGSRANWSGYQFMMNKDWLRSQDCVTWTPCSKEVGA